jgi:hypothetical protein
MIRLAAASLKLPRSLYIRDINIGPIRDAAVMGGHADIYTAQYRGNLVALKRLRHFNMRESDLHKVSWPLNVELPVRRVSLIVSSLFSSPDSLPRGSGLAAA